MLGDEDLQSIIDDLNESCMTFGGSTIKVIVDRYDEEILRLATSAKSIGKMISVKFRTDACGFEGLDVNGLVSIDSVLHTVRHRMQLDDGAITKILCSRN